MSSTCLKFRESYVPLPAGFFLTHMNHVFKGKRRQKTCHWVPIGAMGPADIGTALYPPHSSDGMRVRYLYCLLYSQASVIVRTQSIFISIQTYIGAQTKRLYLNSPESIVSITNSVSNPVSLHSTVYSKINVLFSLFLCVFLLSLYTLHMYKEKYVFYTFLSPPPPQKRRAVRGGGQNTCSLLCYCIYSWCCVCIV